MRSAAEFINPAAPGKTKFIFFSGKGGVGKSTMSCSTALWLAGKGYKTLIVTTDPAPNLADIFKQEIGHRVTAIKNTENLFAIEIDPDEATSEYKERIIAPMRELLDEKNIKVIDEQLNSPCVEEVAAFDKFIEFMDEPAYDAVVFDTAPTGHTIRLLELPSGWSNSLKEGASTCIGPGASLHQAKSRYERAVRSLQDADGTSFVFVLRPEHSSVLEVQRSMAELEKLGIRTSFLIVNGLLPEEACTDSFSREIKKREDGVIEEIKNVFNLPSVFFPLRDSEVSGLAHLEKVGAHIYEAREDPQGIPGGREEDGPEDFEEANKNIPELFGSAAPPRYLFFTGKGGVGKSTIAAAASVYSADMGYKTLIVTTDPASHLYDLFGQAVEHEPVKIEGVEGLFAAKIDQRKALAEYRERILREVRDMGEETVKSVEEDLNSPCAEEMAAFEKFMSYFENDDYDTIIFDTAPTGHTLRLLELPSDWKGFIDLGTLTKKASGKTADKYSGVIEKMRNREKSSFVFVMHPEHTPIAEAWRASEDLKRQVGIETAAVAVNNLIPENLKGNDFFKKRRKQQAGYLRLIKDKFKVPALFVFLEPHEPRGVDNLRELAGKIFARDGGVTKTHEAAGAAAEVPSGRT